MFKRISSALRALTGVSAVVTALVLIYEAACIGFGSRPFTQDAIAAGLAHAAYPFCAFILLLFVTVFARAEKAAPVHKAEYRAHASSGKAVFRVRLIILMAALLFIVTGIINGGLHDVFVKAVNICTECIGLG